VVEVEVAKAGVGEDAAAAEREVEGGWCGGW
jgi:hypothetical protein